MVCSLQTYLVLISLCGLICMLIRGARELSRGLYLCATSPWYVALVDT